MEDLFENLFDRLLILFFAVFGGAARFAIAPPVVRSLWSCVGSLVTAGFSGVLMWQLLEGLSFSPQIVAAGVGIAGLLGDDLLKAILKLGLLLKKDPFCFISRVLNLFTQFAKGVEKQAEKKVDLSDYEDEEVERSREFREEVVYGSDVGAQRSSPAIKRIQREKGRKEEGRK